MDRSEYRSELDGVRTICILLTIANHTPNVPFAVNGTVGVDIFFALSGWLITSLLITENENTKSINVPAFYVRRFFRIIPLYVLTVILYGMAAVAMQRLHGDETDLQNYVYALPWLLTFNSEYRSTDAGNIFGQAWTLGVEEKFYLIWPLFMLAYLKGHRIALILLIPVLLFLVGLNDEFGLLRGYLGLMFGTALAVACRTKMVSAFLENPTTTYGALIVIVVAYGLSRLSPHPFHWNILISFSSAFFIGGLWMNRQTRVGKILSIRPLAYAGKLTYAIYLTHVLVINAVAIALNRFVTEPSFTLIFVVSYVACIALGTALHFSFERPLIDMGRKISRSMRVGRRVAVPTENHPT